MASLVIRGAVTSFVSHAPRLVVKEKLPACSSDFCVRAQTVTVPERPVMSAPEWFVTTNFTCGFFLASSRNRTPETSMYFWYGLTLAGDFAAGGAAGAAAEAGCVVAASEPPFS